MKHAEAPQRYTRIKKKNMKLQHFILKLTYKYEFEVQFLWLPDYTPTTTNEFTKELGSRIQGTFQMFVIEIGHRV